MLRLLLFRSTMKTAARLHQAIIRQRITACQRSISSASDLLLGGGSLPSFTDNKLTFFSDHVSDSTLLKVVNPATQEELAHAYEISDSEFSNVISKASVAFQEWSNVPVQQRQRVMLQYQALIRDHMDELAKLITYENGKTIQDSKGDIFRGLEVVETACNVATQMQGDTLMGISSTVDTHSYRVPLGVCAGICPFNFPAMIPLWMFPLAVSCGNAFVLKPSEKTPLTSLYLASLAEKAGLPPNVLQVIHGSKSTVDRICTSPEIRAISFVGGNEAGEHIFDLGTRHGKRVQSNMGAKNHVVVLPDADRNAVVKAIVGAAFGAAGQRCMALSVLILVGSSQDWINDIVEQARELKVGAGWEEGVDVGPLITPSSKHRVESILEDAVAGGARLLLDGRECVVSPSYSKGNFIGPTVVQVASTNNAAYQREIFGPVLCCLHTDTFDEAVRIVNRNPYGNGCAIFTSSGGAARKFVHDVEAGQVGINVPIPVPLPMFSFTGNKASIRGDLNFYGKTGVQFYTQLRTVTSNWAVSNNKIDFGGTVMPTMK